VTQDNAQKITGTLRGDQNTLIFEQGFSFSGYERDGLYLNREGKKYFEVSGVSGIDSVSDGRAGVFADFDNDGDNDVFITTLQGDAHLLFRNNVGQDNRSVRILLEGTESGHDAFGAVVRLKTSAGTLAKVKAGGSGYLSQHDSRLLFGLGNDAAAQGVEVTWPNGKKEAFGAQLEAGTTFLLREGSGRAERVNVAKAKLPDPLSRTQVLARGLKIQQGRPLPDVQVKTLSGESVPMSKLLKPGRRTVVNLWATWCIPCRKEMPELERLHKRLAARGVDLVGLNVDTEPNAPIKKFLAATPVTYPVYVAGVSGVEKLFASEEMSVPLSILLDEKGNVVELIPGWSGETRRRFEAMAGAVESSAGAK